MNLKMDMNLDKKEFSENNVSSETNNNIVDNSKKVTNSKPGGLTMVNTATTNNVNDTNAFKEKEIVNQIYSMNENDIAIVSSKDYKKNYLVFLKESINKKSKDDNNEYEKYLKISNSNLSNKILGAYDLYLNKKYKVDVNQKALDKVKNMYR